MLLCMFVVNSCLFFNVGSVREHALPYLRIIAVTAVGVLSTSVPVLLVFIVCMCQEGCVSGTGVSVSSSIL